MLPSALANRPYERNNSNANCAQHHFDDIHKIYLIKSIRGLFNCDCVSDAKCSKVNNSISMLTRQFCITSSDSVGLAFLMTTIQTVRQLLNVIWQIVYKLVGKMVGFLEDFYFIADLLIHLDRLLRFECWWQDIWAVTTFSVQNDNILISNPVMTNISSINRMDEQRKLVHN